MAADLGLAVKSRVLLLSRSYGWQKTARALRKAMGLLLYMSLSAARILLMRVTVALARAIALMPALT